MKSTNIKRTPSKAYKNKNRKKIDKHIPLNSIRKREFNIKMRITIAKRGEIE
jgi:hypothetical protein